MEKVTISLLNILIILLISSCSSSYKQPETFSSKMNRFNPHTEKVNLIPSPPPLPQGLMFSRRPASIENKPKNKKKLKPSRHLYFLTLFEQYQKIKAYSSATLPKINTCPHFHTPLLKEGFKYSQSKSKKKLNYAFLNKKHFEDLNFLSTSPELYLPMTEKSKKPKVIDIIKTQDKEIWPLTIQKALSYHAFKTFREIEQLCQVGKSTNYYNFQNLLTTIQKSKNEFKPSRKNLAILLKTTIFSNMALISSLRKKELSRTPASLKKDTKLKKQILSRMKAPWAQDYFNFVKRR
ncbi:MAG: hypothetical protein CME68_09665 [Halobacteriovoraceae bacterium]|nr:hypothetical protein [Halobacteriovoraceae bacterium]